MLHWEFSSSEERGSGEVIWALTCRLKEHSVDMITPYYKTMVSCSVLYCCLCCVAWSPAEPPGLPDGYPGARVDLLKRRVLVRTFSNGGNGRAGDGASRRVVDSMWSW